MDIATIDDVIYWINRRPDWVFVSTGEVVAASREAEISQEAKDVIAGLPDREWTREELVAELRERMVARV